MSKLSSWKTVLFLCVLCALGAIASSAQTFKSLVNFDRTNGAYPYYGSLAQGLDGNFYGTTEQGGLDDGGTIFKITPAGKLTTLHSFCTEPYCAAGYRPVAGLVQASNGNFYGTTPEGGVHAGGGVGTVFVITPGRTLTTLYSFCAEKNCLDGYQPYAGLIQASNGNFYGTTEYGGAGTACGSPGCGTVFEITPAGKLTTLHSFNGSDGESPMAGLVQATNGNFYGTTYGGGAHNDGTVFEITPAGKLTTLHSFYVDTDGAWPNGPLIQATDGNFYGTTYGGGRVSMAQGTLFKITAAGTLTTAHNFIGVTDGDHPLPGVLQATNGTFYGTTSAGSGGANDYGAQSSASQWGLAPSWRHCRPLAL